jgi:DNA-directed RNA polymerase subunit M/transcription elongation factor TFIIS
VITFHVRNEHANKKEKDQNLQCDKCDFLATGLEPYELERHNLNVHVKKDTTTLKCDNCEYETPLETALKKHSKTVHEPVMKQKLMKQYTNLRPNEPQKNVHVARQNNEDKQKKEVKREKCKECDYEYTDNGDVIKHLVAKHL